MLLFGLENIGNSVFTLTEVKWLNDSSVQVECFNDFLVKKVKQEETYRKVVLYLQLKIQEKVYKEGRLQIKYIDINGKKRKVYSPSIIIDKDGLKNKQLLNYQLFTKYQK